MTALRFRDQEIVFASGARGQNYEIPSANPVNYFHVISNPADLPRLTIDGKLFLPATDRRKADGKWPLVMVVPGSLGVAASHASASGEMDCVRLRSPSYGGQVAAMTVEKGVFAKRASFRGDAKHRTRNLEIPQCAIAHWGSLRAPE